MLKTISKICTARNIWKKNHVLLPSKHFKVQWIRVIRRQTCSCDWRYESVSSDKARGRYREHVTRLMTRFSWRELHNSCQSNERASAAELHEPWYRDYGWNLLFLEIFLSIIFNTVNQNYSVIMKLYFFVLQICICNIEILYVNM